MLEAIRVGLIGRGGTLFDGFDGVFREGDVWAVTAPASAGKSRLLATLHGEGRPDAGDVLADGVSIYRGSPDAASRFRRGSALVTDLVEPESETIGDLFRLAAMAAGNVPEAERREREASLLAMVGLAGGSGWTYRSLSQSERFRAGLAVELFRGPRVLLLDGPVSRIGKEWTDMLCSLFRALARERRLIVFAERELPPAFPMKPVRESLGSGPFTLVQLASGTASEAAE